MSTFSYTARDLGGNIVNGIIEAEAPSGAAASLREQGLFPTKIEQVRNAAAAASVVTPPRVPEIGYNGPVAPSSTATAAPPIMPMAPSAPSGPSRDPFDNGALRIQLFPMFTGTNLPELAMMYRQLGTLLNAGVPMVQAIATLAEQTRSPKLRTILRECTNSVASGYPLSSVFARYPGIFTPLQYEMIRAGETSGMLELMCSRLAGYIEREIELRRKLKRETTYPKIVISLAGLVILLLAGLMGGPKIFALALTLELSALGGGIFIWWLGRYLYQFPAFAAAWDGFKLYIPVLGSVVRGYSTARFTRALGTLYAGGVLISNAVEIAARACGNGAIAKRLLDNAPALNQGEGLSGMLERSGLLSPLAIQMARTGEQTGSLDQMMEKVADYLEDEADVKSHQAATGLGVAMMLIAGLIVLILAIVFFQGYFSSVFKAGDEAG